MAGFSLESRDVLDTSDPSKFSYRLQAWNQAEDGADFSFPLNSNVCFNATTHSNVRLGSGAVAKSLPLDLNTLLNCGVNTGPQPGDECGAPAYDANTERGAYLWKDCGSTNAWHLRVTAGGRSTGVNYVGSITSSDPVSLSTFSLEYRDNVNTSNRSNISYNLYVYGGGEDGLDFNVSSYSGGCFNITELTGGNLYLGASKSPVAGPIDLQNLGSCQ